MPIAAPDPRTEKRGVWPLTSDTVALAPYATGRPGEPDLGALAAPRFFPIFASAVDTRVTPSYRVVASNYSVNEGGFVTFSIVTTGVPVGSSIDYSLSGITRDDLVSGELSGRVAVTASGTQGVATLTLEFKKDRVTEGAETIKLKVGNTTTQVTLNDTSRTPTYTLSGNVASINEGEAAVFLLNTTNVADGTVLTYQITGVQAADVPEGLSGKTVVVSGGQAVIAIATRVDFTREFADLVVGKDNQGQDIIRRVEGLEKMTVTVEDATASVQLRDWTTEATYRITPITQSVNEGAPAKFLLRTFGLMPGSAVRYEIAGSTDLSDISNPWGANWGVAHVSGTFSNGQAIISIPTVADRVTEGTEQVRIAIGNQSAMVIVADTSTAPTYSVKALLPVVKEGRPVNFMVTSNAGADSWINYIITGKVDASDIGIALEGRLRLNSQSKATLAIPTIEDGLLEGKEIVTVTIVGTQATASAYLADSP